MRRVEHDCIRLKVGQLIRWDQGEPEQRYLDLRRTAAWRSELQDSVHEFGISGWVAVDYLVGASEGSGSLVGQPQVVAQLALPTEK